jgi:uncharacterized membrane protein YkoI
MLPFDRGSLAGPLRDRGVPRRNEIVLEDTMRTIMRSLGSLAAVGLLVLVVGARADEEKVPLDKVPKAVLDAVKARFPNAKLIQAEKETENGKTVYEIGIKDKDQKIDVTVTPDGKIAEIEKTIATTALPATVSAALEKKYPKATLQKAEEIIKVTGGKEKLAYYEVVLVTAQKKKLEVEVAPDGKIAKEEDKSKEKKEEKKK